MAKDFRDTIELRFDDLVREIVPSALFWSTLRRKGVVTSDNVQKFKVGARNICLQFS